MKRKEIALKIAETLQSSDHSRLTVDEMCKAANIAKGTFYHYFASKEDLLSEALYAMPIDELLSIVEEDIKKSGSFMEAILLYTKTYSEHVMSSGHEICRTVILEMMSPENLRFHTYEKRTGIILYDIIKSWQEKGQVTDKLEARAICEMIFVTVRGYLLNWYASPDKYDLTALMTEHIRIFASSLLVQ